MVKSTWPFFVTGTRLPTLLVFHCLIANGNDDHDEHVCVNNKEETA